MVVKKKIVLLGDSAVGKTSLIRRFVYDHFEDSYIATVGTKVTRKEMLITRPSGTEKLKMMIWDVIGREGYHAVHSRSFVGVHGALLVTDLTRDETLHNLEQYWIPSLYKVAENVPMVFTCNKSDLRGDFEFGTEDLVEVASKYNPGIEQSLPRHLSTSYSTSAKTGSNVEMAFESLAMMMLSEERPDDPLRELYESLVASRIRRTSGTITSIGALDAIIVDFSEQFDDQRLALAVLRLELARAGVDVRNPTREGLLKAIDFLADAELEFHDRDTVVGNQERRLGWASQIK